MKKLLCVIMMVIIFISAVACDGVYTNDLADKETVSLEPKKVQFDEFVYSKDGVDDVWPTVKEYYSQFMEGRGDSAEDYLYFKYRNLDNITPKRVAEQLNARIYDSNGTEFIEMNGEVSVLGYGIVNMIPWDYDENGNMDLLIASWSGSGVHYVQLWVYNTETKETHNIYDGIAGDNVNFAVTDEAPEGESNPNRCYVHTVNITAESEYEEIMLDSGYMDVVWYKKSRSLEDKGIRGYIEYKDGKFVFEDYPWD